MRYRSRWMNLLTLVAIVVVAGLLYFRPWTRTRRPVMVERQVIGARGIAPAPEFLLRHAGELKLTEAQRTRLETLARAYRKDVAHTQAQLDAATRSYQQYLERARQTHQSASDLAAAARELERLSAVVASTRHAYWEQALGALSPAQRASAEALARKASVRDLV